MKALPLHQLSFHPVRFESLLMLAGGQRWSSEAVEAHKQAELAKAPPPSILWPYFFRMRATNLAVKDFGENIMMWCGGVAITAVLLTAVVIALWLIGVASGGVLVGMVSVTGISAIGSLVGWTIYEGCFQLGEIVRIRPPAAWKALSLGHYKALKIPMPAQAHELIAQAELIAPKPSITIHTLMQERRILDPLLEINGIICLGWDERGEIISPPF